MYTPREENRGPQKFRRKAAGKCCFCEQHSVPDYKDIKTFKNLLTEKGKIVSRSRTGTCQRHQRNLAEAVSRARFMAILGYVPAAL